MERMLKIIEIDLNEKIYNLAKLIPDFVEIMIQISPKYKRLKNPLLMKTIARTANLQDAANLANLNFGYLTNSIKDYAKNYGLEVRFIDKKTCHSKEIKIIDPPSNYHFLDYYPNEDLEKGIVPANKVVNLLKDLKENEGLRIITDFEPVPLIRILENKNFKVSRAKENKEIFIYYIWK